MVVLGKSRDLSIDFLRFLGISLIILAHVFPPLGLLDFRCFDVPLMLFISGLAYGNKDIKVSASFFWKRIKRLLIPVYGFLIFYFSTYAFAYFILKIDLGIQMKHVVGSFLLMDGIGYVWIIRVFLLVTLLTPWLIKINKWLVSNSSFMASLILLVMLQEFFVVHVHGWFLLNFVYYATGYSIPFLLGLRLAENRRALKCIGGGNALIFIVLFAYYCIENQLEYVWINNFKYPPRAYFIAYGLSMSSLCYFIVQKISLLNNLKIALFIGQNTIWIYLWHIPLVQLTGLMDIHWMIRFVLVYIMAVSICYTQVVIVNKLQGKIQKNTYLKYFKG